MMPQLFGDVLFDNLASSVSEGHQREVATKGIRCRAADQILQALLDRLDDLRRRDGGLRAQQKEVDVGWLEVVLQQADVVTLDKRS